MVNDAIEDFYGEIMLETRAKIREYVKERQKVQYLFDMQTNVERAFFHLAAYEHARDTGARAINRLFAGEMLKDDIKEILHLQGKIIGRKVYTGVTDEEVQKAKDYPIENMIQFKGSVALCPFHGDKNPSMSKIKNQNKVHCFSCGKTWDTIQVAIELEGLDFGAAVRFLNRKTNQGGRG